MFVSTLNKSRRNNSRTLPGQIIRISSLAIAVGLGGVVLLLMIQMDVVVASSAATTEFGWEFLVILVLITVAFAALFAGIALFCIARVFVR